MVNMDTQRHFDKQGSRFKSLFFGFILICNFPGKSLVHFISQFCWWSLQVHNGRVVVVNMIKMEAFCMKLIKIFSILKNYKNHECRNWGLGYIFISFCFIYLLFIYCLRFYLMLYLCSNRVTKTGSAKHPHFCQIPCSISLRYVYELSLMD